MLFYAGVFSHAIFCVPIENFDVVKHGVSYDVNYVVNHAISYVRNWHSKFRSLRVAYDEIYDVAYDVVYDVRIFNRELCTCLVGKVLLRENALRFKGPHQMCK